MRLRIQRTDGIVNVIDLKETEPSLETVNNAILLLENYYYRLSIVGNDESDSLELFVGDYSIPLHYNIASDCYETEMGLLFEGCFDLASISVFIDSETENGRYLYTDFLRVATTKQTAQQVEKMLNEIEENLPNFLEVCFSRNRKKSGVNSNGIKSIWNTLKLVDEITKIYEESYSLFSNNKKSSVEMASSIVDIKSMNILNQESLIWIARNPDNLVATKIDSGIVVKGINYMPSKIKTHIPQYSYDVYENQVVLGFLKSLINYLEVQIAGFNKEIMEFENIPDIIACQIPNTHELTGRCVYIYYKGVVTRYSEREIHLQELFYKYERALQCSPEIIYGVPKLTNTFKKVYHYRLCYECMVKWFDSGEYLFDHLNYLFKLKTLSRIFEYYCLIKLQTALIQCGFKLIETNRIIYDAENDEEDINNQYVFTKDGYELKLLYEPYIWTNKVSAETNLYSTGYNFSKSLWNDKWTPDFVLAINRGGRSYYLILDAKYSSINNIKKYYMPELVLKYGSQIASKDKFYSDIFGIGAIYPGNRDTVYYFKKNEIHSQKKSLPEYFSLPILSEDYGTKILRERLLELIGIVDALEIEKEQEEIIKEKSVQMSHSIGESENKEMMLEKVIEIKPKDEQEPGNQQATSQPAVNGKKCFYFSKNMCLHQKNMCKIVDAPCPFYISKNEKELLKNETSCRNMVIHTRKGRISRMECIVSGFNGCVGPDNCKFYLRKNSDKVKDKNDNIANVTV